MNIGDLVQINVTFTTVASGAAINPTSVVITVRAPDGTISTPAVSNPTTGTYTAQVAITMAGEWLWHAAGTGAAQAATQGAFSVEPNSF